jgi:hypothetical protein
MDAGILPPEDGEPMRVYFDLVQNITYKSGLPGAKREIRFVDVEDAEEATAVLAEHQRMLIADGWKTGEFPLRVQ